MKLIKPFYEKINVTLITNIPDYELVERDFKDYEKDLQTVNLTFRSNYEIYIDNLKDEFYDVYKYDVEPNSRMKFNEEQTEFYITTSYEIIRKNKWFNDLKYCTRPSDFHEKRISIKFSCDIFTIEKLINIAKEFNMLFNILPIQPPIFPNKPFEYVIPIWMNIEEGNYHCSNIWSESFPYPCTDKIEREYWGFKKDHTFGEYSDQSENEKEVQVAEFLHSIYNAEDSYLGMIDAGCTHEHAITILPTPIKREIILTGYELEWENMIDLYGKLDIHNFVKKRNIEMFYAPK